MAQSGYYQKEVFPPRKRWHHKTTSGCITCRKRRVKCDEQKPICKSCARNGFVCHGEDYQMASVVNDEGNVGRGIVHGVALVVPTPSNINHPDGRYSRPQALLTALTASKGDPFNSFCVDYSPRQHQQIFDHAISAQWSLFATSEKSSDLALVKTEIMSHIVHSRVSYYTLLYAGACHRLFWKESFERSPTRTSNLLFLKNRAIQAMIETIKTNSEPPSDELIMAMVVLASHGSADTAQRRRLGRVQGRKSLVRTLEAEYWCALDTEGPHMDILAETVQKRGGVRNIGSGVLPTAMYLFDIFDSHMHLQRPRLDSLMPLNFALSMRTWSCDAIEQQRFNKSMDGFSEVFSCMGTSTSSADLQEIVRGFVLVELDLAQLDRCTKTSQESLPHYATIIWIRSMCIREVLLLPDCLGECDNTGEEIQIGQLVYEMCRLSCSLICQVWLFADCSATRNLPRQMVDKLYPLLLRSTTGNGSSKLCNTLPDFFLWNLILGIMLAYEDFDETGDSTGLHKISVFVKSAIVKAEPAAWSVVSASLPRFLWPVKEQDETGREAWEFVCQILSNS